jgi:predicted permease
MVIRVLALLVPRTHRDRWREEWLAELAATPRQVGDRRVLGAFKDVWATRSTHRTSGPRPSAAWSFESLRDDVYSGARQVLRHPGVSLMAMGVIALGTGFTTALFSVVYGAFFTPWPVDEPERLALVYRSQPSGRLGISSLANAYNQRSFDLSTDIDGVVGVTGSWGMEFNVSIGDLTERHYGELTTATYFDVLGVSPLMGRTFVPDDEASSNPDLVVIVSHALWQDRLDGDADVVGRQVFLNKAPATIIGVMPPAFRGITSRWARSEWWALQPQLIPRAGTSTIVRLQPGATTAHIEAALAPHGDAELTRIRRTSPTYALPPGHQRFQVIPLTDLQTPQDPGAVVVPTRIMTAMAGVVGAVLLIAVMNIGSLLAARGLSRAPELATRRLLGITNGRLVRQLMAETWIVSTAGALAGVLLSQVLTSTLIATSPDQLRLGGGLASRVDPSLFLQPLDWRALVAALVAAAAIGAIASLAPIRRALRTNIVTTLAAGSAMATSSRSRSRYYVVIPQLALSLLLLTAAGVHVRSLLSVEANQRGYRVDGATLISLGRDTPTSMAPPNRTQQEIAEDYQRVYRSLLETLRSRADVHAGLFTSLPLTATSSPDVAAADGTDPQMGGMTTEVQRAAVSPGALGALGMRILDGRDFDDRDTRQMGAVAIISEATARRLWPGQRAVGQRIGAFSPTQSTPKTDWYEVIGVVGDTQPILPRSTDPPKLYTSLGQAWQPWAYHLIVASGSTTGALAELRSAIDAVDPYSAVFRMQPLSASVDQLLYPRRLAATVLTASGVIGLVLASIGLYGVMSFSVSRRLRELGIRAALGARPQDLVSLVLSEGGRVVVIATTVGLGGAIAALRMTAHLAEGVPTSDGLIFAAVPITLAVVVAAACLGPARRAGRIDPVITLKG